jgi:hypothetical protein
MDEPAKHSEPLRFVTETEMQVETLPWGPHDWLCRPGLTDARDLLLVRVHMPPGQGHKFHAHPEMEEIIYVLTGRAEQGVVHGTYNAGSTVLEFLAILSPAKISGPALVDVSNDEPWHTLRGRP